MVAKQKKTTKSVKNTSLKKSVKKNASKSRKSGVKKSAGKTQKGTKKAKKKPVKKNSVKEKTRKKVSVKKKATKKVMKKSQTAVKKATKKKTPLKKVSLSKKASQTILKSASEAPSKIKAKKMSLTKKSRDMETQRTTENVVKTRIENNSKRQSERKPSTNETPIPAEVKENSFQEVTHFEESTWNPPEQTHSWDPFATPIEPPTSYLKDRIILLVIDPKFMYTYWEVKPETYDAGKNFIGHDSELNLRIYDTTAIESFNGYNAHHFWDIPVHSLSGGWYVRLQYADKNLVVDIGLKNSKGDYYTLVRSNFAQIPRDSLAHTDKIYWMTVNEEGHTVITEVEDLTDEDLELLRKMLGEEMYRQLLKGTLIEAIGASQIRELFYESNIPLSPLGGASEFVSSPGGASELITSKGAALIKDSSSNIAVLADPKE